MDVFVEYQFKLGCFYFCCGSMPPAMIVDSLGDLGLTALMKLLSECPVSVMFWLPALNNFLHLEVSTLASSRFYQLNIPKAFQAGVLSGSHFPAQFHCCSLFCNLSLFLILILLASSIQKQLDQIHSFIK